MNFQEDAAFQWSFSFKLFIVLIWVWEEGYSYASINIQPLKRAISHIFLIMVLLNKAIIVHPRRRPQVTWMCW
jgi:hypothetical protein